MKFFFTLFFASIGLCAIAQETAVTVPGKQTINATDQVSLRMQRRTKRFTSYISNHTQKIYEEAVLDDVNAFEGVPVMDMNRLAGYAFYQESDTNEKLKHAKKLQISCENAVRIQNFREGIKNALAVVLQIER